MNEKKRKKPLSLGKKLTIALLIVALICAAAYGAYYLLHYHFYDDYKSFLSGYTYEAGTELELQNEKLTGYKDYKLVCQTDVLKMYLDTKTSNIAIEDLRTGVVTFAAPPNADDDAFANNKNIEYLKSHLIISYYNNARAEGTYDSYSMSVNREQVTYEAIENGVRVIYDMGDYGNAMIDIPLYMSIETYDRIVAQLDDTEASSMNRYYSVNSDIEGMRQLLTNVQSNRMSQSKIRAIFAKVGFTEEDAIAENALAGVQTTVPISFTVPLEYRLEGDHVEVSVPVCAIEERGGGSIFKIQVLRNFAAADQQKTGYIVVPNGDGSIINFNNGKSNATVYSQFIYGIDPLAADYLTVEASNHATMNLFAICSEDATVLATVEDGATLASITAGVSGNINSYNYAYTTFVVRGSEKLEMFGSTGNESNLPVVEPKPYDSMLTVRYSFLDEAHSGYSGVANYYRQRLIDEGVLTVQAPEDNIKFYYDVICGVEMTESFLGAQYMGLTSMTTFDEAALMAKTLFEAGISDQVMNLQGWFNDGYYHEVADYVWVNWKLGGKNGLEELNNTIKELGGDLYADVAFQKVTYDSERFAYQIESSKYYASGYAAGFGQVNPVTLRQTASLGYHETCYDLISPKFLPRYVSRFAEAIEQYDISGISLRDLGSTLQSDKKRTEQINREQALDVVLAQLSVLDKTDKNLLINLSNAYAWAYADDIQNLPLGDNEYVIIDHDIPLYEMIVHGCIDYCGSVYTLTDTHSADQMILNMIEYGAAPHFVFTWNESSEMKYSGMNSFYATTFATWKDEAVSVYDQINTVLKQVSGATMVSHRIVTDAVRVITYSNGVQIWVNYGNADVTVDGVNIPASGFTVK